MYKILRWKFKKAQPLHFPSVCPAMCPSFQSHPIQLVFSFKNQKLMSVECFPILFLSCLQTILKFACPNGPQCVPQYSVFFLTLSLFLWVRMLASNLLGWVGLKAPRSESSHTPHSARTTGVFVCVSSCWSWSAQSVPFCSWIHEVCASQVELKLLDWAK